MQTFTVRQLAELVQKPHEKISTTIDRLAHWTDENMLTVHGDRNPGTGRKRLYERSALFEALTLSVLSEAIGSPVTSPEFIKVFRASRPLDFATKEKGTRFLVVAYSRAKGAEFGTTWARGLAAHVAGSPHEAHVVIDLWTLAKRVEEFANG